ncbi:hypothetical protein CQW23_04646 [Capsicum baccatum]|uniref:Calmodulin-binding domain-containing protein n=1 Tax=Capsicum baccatum TaxID=33114 RepID=A0A2G2XFA0_CAPBA|nr:hypothetical protein CQW23_04646 [Capsicum baccatum]
MVEQKPSSPPGCIEGGIDEVTIVEQKSSASLVSMLREGENMTVVEQKLSTPLGSMLVEGKKEAVVNQKPSSPLGSMLGQGKKLNVVDRRPSPKVHSLEPSKIKKMLLTPKSVHSLKLDSSSDKMPETEKKMISSSKILGEDEKEVVKSADSALGKYTSSIKKLLHIAEAEIVGKNQKKTLRKGKTSCSYDNNSSAVKLKFRRGKIVDLQQETSSPRRLTFRWGRHDVQEKKDMQGLLNNVIEETTSKLVETEKSKVKALVGAFETVTFLHNKPSAVTVS